MPSYPPPHSAPQQQEIIFTHPLFPPEATTSATDSRNPDYVTRSPAPVMSPSRPTERQPVPSNPPFLPHDPTLQSAQVYPPPMQYGFEDSLEGAPSQHGGSSDTIARATDSRYMFHPTAADIAPSYGYPQYGSPPYEPPQFSTVPQPPMRNPQFHPASPRSQPSAPFSYPPPGGFPSSSGDTSTRRDPQFDMPQQSPYGIPSGFPAWPSQFVQQFPQGSVLDPSSFLPGARGDERFVTEPTSHRSYDSSYQDPRRDTLRTGPSQSSKGKHREIDPSTVTHDMSRSSRGSGPLNEADFEKLLLGYRTIMDTVSQSSAAEPMPDTPDYIDRSRMLERMLQTAIDGLRMLDPGAADKIANERGAAPAAAPQPPRRSGLPTRAATRGEPDEGPLTTLPKKPRLDPGSTGQEPQRCLGCGVTNTPEWRRGPLGPRTLCNACGLVYAKIIKKRARDSSSRVMTTASHPRASASNPPRQSFGEEYRPSSADGEGSEEDLTSQSDEGRR